MLPDCFLLALPDRRLLLCCVAWFQVSAQADRVRSGHKRKLSELQSTLQQQMADAEQKMGKLTAKSGKVEQVGNVFKKFMAAAE